MSHSEFHEALTAADQKMHKVEDQWHYPIMTKYGWVAETKEAQGFVRKYAYTHPDKKVVMLVAHGYNGDYWVCKDHPHDGYTGDYWRWKDKAMGYYRELEKFVAQLACNKPL